MARLTRATTTLGRKGRSDAAPAESVIGIREEYITLAQLLKVAGIVGTGGEAKYYLTETPVLVNGEPEQRRGKKLRPGDVVIAPGAAPIRLASKGVRSDFTPAQAEE